MVSLARVRRFLWIVFLLSAPAWGSATLTVSTPSGTPAPGGAYVQLDLVNCSLGAYVNSSTLVPQSQRFYFNSTPSVTFTVADNVTGIICPVPTSTQSAPNLLSYYTVSYVTPNSFLVLKSVELPPGTFNLANLANLVGPPYSPGIVQGPAGMGLVGPPGCVVGTTCQSTFLSVITFPALQAAVASCGTITACLIGISANITFTTSLTIPSNITIYPDGGILNVPTGTSLMVANVIAPAAQVFSGAGTISGLNEVKPEWFGPSTTLLQAINAANPNGATVTLGWATYTTGMESYVGNPQYFTLARSNLFIRGSGMPQPNGAITTTTTFLPNTGTILRGPVGMIGSNLSFSDFGVDIGNTLGASECNQYGGLVVTPNSISSPVLSNIRAENITVVGCTATFAPSSFQHATLFENCTGLVQKNITTYNSFYGDVEKCTNVSWTNIVENNHPSFSAILKSDDIYGITSNVNINGLTINNGGPFALDTYAGVVTNVNVVNFAAHNCTGPGIQGNCIFCEVNPDPGNPTFQSSINTVNFTNFLIDGASRNGVECQNGSTQMKFSHGIIRNIPAGVAMAMQTFGPTSHNTVDDVSISNIGGTAPMGGYGAYMFGATDAVSNIHCTSVPNGCIVSSAGNVGATEYPGKVHFANVDSDGPLFYTFPYGSFAGDVYWAVTAACTLGASAPSRCASLTTVPFTPPATGGEIFCQSQTQTSTGGAPDLACSIVSVNGPTVAFDVIQLLANGSTASTVNASFHAHYN